MDIGKMSDAVAVENGVEAGERNLDFDELEGFRFEDEGIDQSQARQAEESLLEQPAPGNPSGIRIIAHRESERLTSASGSRAT
jgi:hypothetical protein